MRVFPNNFSRIFFWNFSICAIAAGGDPGLLPRRILPLPGKAGGGPGRVPLQVIRNFFLTISQLIFKLFVIQATPEGL